MLAWLAWSCAVTAPAPIVAPAAATSADAAQAQGLTRDLLARERRLVGLQTDAVMRYQAATGSLKARETISVRRSGRLRVEVMSPFGPALVLAASGGQLGIYDPGQNVFYRGRADAATLARFVRIPMDPGPAVRLLLGLMPQELAPDSIPSSVRRQDDLLVADYRLASGGTEELGFSGGHLALVRLSGVGRQAGYQVRYSDYLDIGGLQFPHHLQAEFAAAGARLDVRYERPIVNPALSDALFVLAPGAGAREVNLDSAGAGMGSNG
ncbi:MAG TPA: DUF4292 domain-containing protein [Candidatus Binataceae bacterium]|nr:DUF4292 domain-containing protein [Candidatus Binataceae bacterium]